MEQLARAKNAFQLLRKNLVIFVPNILMLFFNLAFFVVFLYLTGIIDLIFGGTSSYIFTIKNLIYLIVYLVIIAKIDNFLTCSKYGMIKDLILKGSTDLASGFKFGKKYFFKALKIHFIVFLLLVVPTLIIAAFLFTVDPNYIVQLLFVLFLIVYLVLISIRLLFLYPVMTFEDKGAYNSLKEDFHYVKAHLHHTVMTWIFVVGVGLTFSMFKQMVKTGLTDLSKYVIIGAVLGAVVLILLEIGVSIWEHIFIFQSYLEGKKKKRKVKKIKIKIRKKKISKRK